MAKEKEFLNIFGVPKKQSVAKHDDKAESTAAAKERQADGLTAEARYARCMERARELKDRIEAAYESNSISPRVIEKYLETPTNFSSKDWQAVGHTKQEIEEKLELLKRKIAPPKPPPPTEGTDGGAAGGEKKGGPPAPPKGERPKTAFVSKKKWISMR